MVDDVFFDTVPTTFVFGTRLYWRRLLNSSLGHLFKNAFSSGVDARNAPVSRYFGMRKVEPKWQFC